MSSRMMLAVLLCIQHSLHTEQTERNKDRPRRASWPCVRHLATLTTCYPGSATSITRHLRYQNCKTGEGRIFAGGESIACRVVSEGRPAHLPSRETVRPLTFCVFALKLGSPACSRRREIVEGSCRAIATSFSRLSRFRSKSLNTARLCTRPIKHRTTANQQTRRDVEPDCNPSQTRLLLSARSRTGLVLANDADSRSKDSVSPIRMHPVVMCGHWFAGGGRP